MKSSYLEAKWNTNRLIGFSAALVAGVSSNFKHWLDLSAAGHDTTHHHQLADVWGLDTAHC